MNTNFFFLAVVAASSAVVSAQTWTDCNPLEKTCPADPALAGTYEWTYGNAAPDFKTTAGSDVLKYGGKDGAIFRVEKSLDAPTIVSNFYIMWGKLEVTMKAAPGAGIVSSVVLQSDDLDEIDWEWVGAKPNEAQSNYFGKGNTDSYDRGAVHPVASQDGFHTYGLDWTAEKTDWLIDGKVVRSLKPDQVKGDFYPQTPMQVRLGSWAAGDPKNEAGTIQWSGGPTDYSKGPFDMVVKNIKVIDYSTGKEYVYTDKSGSAKSIKAVDGQVGAGPQSGKGNAGNLATPSGSTSAGGAESTGRISKTGLLIPPTGSANGTKSEPTPIGGSGSKANSSESTQQPSSPSSPSSSHNGASGISGYNPAITNGAGFIVKITTTTSTWCASTATGSGHMPVATGGPGSNGSFTGNGTIPSGPSTPTQVQFTGGSAPEAKVMSGMLIGAAVMVVGWLL